MYYVVLDSATSWTVAALFSDEKLLDQRILSNSRKLIEAIQEILHSAKITLKDLSFIGVGIGPGSYTGIRVAVSIAKGMSLALSIPLVGVSSLKGFHPPKHFTGKFITAFDAKISGFYTVAGEQKDGCPYFDSDGEIVSKEMLLEKLSSSSCLVTSSNEVSQKISSSLIIEVAPNAQTLAKHAFKLFQEGKFSKDGSLELLYLRKTQAEINALQ